MAYLPTINKTKTYTPGRNFDLGLFLRVQGRPVGSNIGAPDPRTNFWQRLQQVRGRQLGMQTLMPEEQAAVYKYGKESTAIKGFQKAKGEQHAAALAETRRRATMSQAYKAEQIGALTPDEQSDYYKRQEEIRQGIPDRYKEQQGWDLQDAMDFTRGTGEKYQEYRTEQQRMSPAERFVENEAYNSKINTAITAVWQMGRLVAQARFTEQAFPMAEWSMGDYGVLQQIHRNPTEQREFDADLAEWEANPSDPKFKNIIQNYGSYKTFMTSWFMDRMDDTDPELILNMLTDPTGFTALSQISPLPMYQLFNSGYIKYDTPYDRTWAFNYGWDIPEGATLTFVHKESHIIDVTNLVEGSADWKIVNARTKLANGEILTADEQLLLFWDTTDAVMLSPEAEPAPPAPTMDVFGRPISFGEATLPSAFTGASTTPAATGTEQVTEQVTTATTTVTPTATPLPSATPTVSPPPNPDQWTRIPGPGETLPATTGEVLPTTATGQTGVVLPPPESYTSGIAPEGSQYIMVPDPKNPGSYKRVTRTVINEEEWRTRDWNHIQSMDLQQALFYFPDLASQDIPAGTTFKVQMAADGNLAITATVDASGWITNYDYSDPQNLIVTHTSPQGYIYTAVEYQTYIDQQNALITAARESLTTSIQPLYDSLVNDPRVVSTLTDGRKVVKYVIGDVTKEYDISTATQFLDFMQKETDSLIRMICTVGDNAGTRAYIEKLYTDAGSATPIQDTFNFFNAGKTPNDIITMGLSNMNLEDLNDWGIDNPFNVLYQAWQLNKTQIPLTETEKASWEAAIDQGYPIQFLNDNRAYIVSGVWDPRGLDYVVAHKDQYTPYDYTQTGGYQESIGQREPITPRNEDGSPVTTNSEFVKFLTTADGANFLRNDMGPTPEVIAVLQSFGMTFNQALQFCSAVPAQQKPAAWLTSLGEFVGTAFKPLTDFLDFTSDICKMGWSGLDFYIFERGSLRAQAYQEARDQLLQSKFGGNNFYYILSQVIGVDDDIKALVDTYAPGWATQASNWLNPIYFIPIGSVMRFVGVTGALEAYGLGGLAKTLFGVSAKGGGEAELIRASIPKYFRSFEHLASWGAKHGINIRPAMEGLGLTIEQLESRIGRALRSEEIESIYKTAGARISYRVATGKVPAEVYVNQMEVAAGRQMAPGEIAAAIPPAAYTGVGVRGLAKKARNFISRSDGYIIETGDRVVTARNLAEANHFMRYGNMEGYIVPSTLFKKAENIVARVWKDGKPTDVQHTIWNVADTERLLEGMKWYKKFVVNSAKYIKGDLDAINEAILDAMNEGLIKPEQIAKFAFQLQRQIKELGAAAADNFISSIDHMTGYAMKDFTIDLSAGKVTGNTIQGYTQEFLDLLLKEGAEGDAARALRLTLDKRAWNEVLEYHRYFNFKNPLIHDWIDNSFSVVDAIQELAWRYNLELGRRQFKDVLEVAHYFPRKVTGKKGLDLLYAQSNPAKERVFEFMQDGLVEGYLYDTPTNALRSYIRGTYSRIGREQSNQILFAVFTKGLASQSPIGQVLIKNAVQAKKYMEFSDDLVTRIRRIRHGGFTAQDLSWTNRHFKDTQVVSEIRSVLTELQEVVNIQKLEELIKRTMKGGKLLDEDLGWLKRNFPGEQKLLKHFQIEYKNGKQYITLQPSPEVEELLKNAHIIPEKGNIPIQEIPPATLNDIMAIVKEKDGATWDLLANKNMAETDFYTSSVFKNGTPRNVTLKPGEFNVNKLREFVLFNSDLLNKPEFKLGVWLDKHTGETNLDVVFVTSEYEEALSVGLRYEQKKIFNLKTMAEIPGPEGAILKPVGIEQWKVLLDNTKYVQTEFRKNILFPELKGEYAWNSADPQLSALRKKELIKHMTNVKTQIMEGRQTALGLQSELNDLAQYYPDIVVALRQYDYNRLYPEGLVESLAARKKVGGTTVFRNYNDAQIEFHNINKNFVISDSTLPVSDRTLAIQFSSDLKAGLDSNKTYFDLLYKTRVGYERPADFWEIPPWLAEVKYTIPNTDIMVVRNLDSAITMLEKTKYKRLMFSAMDVNVEEIKALSKVFNGEVIVGGYVPAETFADLSNIVFQKDMEGAAKYIGTPYKRGADYAPFEGTPTIPRLCLSKGCKHNCTFCTVKQQYPKLTNIDSDVIAQQIAEIKKLHPKLVYIDDKTFGQATNFKQLEKVYDELYRADPNFEGFVVQTSPATVIRGDFTAEFIERAHIKYVELGVESYNDTILKDVLNKPHTTKVIDQAMAKLAKTNAKVIPNIMTSLPGETAETYARTLAFLREYKDQISHVNFYAASPYKETKFAELVGGGTPSDLNENTILRSWRSEAEQKLDMQFNNELANFARGQLEKDVIKEELPRAVKYAPGVVWTPATPLYDMIDNFVKHEFSDYGVIRSEFSAAAKARLERLETWVKEMKEDAHAFNAGEKAKRAAYMKEEGTPNLDEGTINMNRFRNKIFVTTKVGNKMYSGQEIAAIIEREFNPHIDRWLRWVNEITRGVVTLKASLDASAPLTFGLYMIGYDFRNLVHLKPTAVFLKATGLHLAVMANPKILAWFRAAHPNIYNEYAAYGMKTASDLTDFYAGLGFLRSSVGKIPLIGDIALIPYGRTSLGFTAFGEIGRVKMIESLETSWLMAGGTKLELAEFSNLVSGTLPNFATPTSANKILLEGCLAFAPNFLRSHLVTLGRMTKGGIMGKELISIYENSWAAWTAIYISLCCATGQGNKMHLYPWDPDFFTFEINGARVGLGGFDVTFVRMIANVIAAASENPDKLIKISENGWAETFGAWEDMFAPMFRWAGYKMAPGASFVKELVTGRDAIGRRLDVSSDYLGEIAKMFMPIVAENIIIDNLPQSPWSYGAAIFGMREYPLSAWDQLNNYADEFIQHIDPAELPEDLRALQEAGTLKWSDLGPLQKLYLAKDPELKELYDAAQLASLDYKSSEYIEWHDTGERISTEKITGQTNSTTALTGGLITTKQYRTELGTLNAATSVKWDELKKSYPEIYAKFEEYRNSGKDSIANFELAYDDWFNLVYGPGTEDDRGNPLFDVITQRKQQWINTWGADYYDLLRQILKTGLAGSPPLVTKLWEDKEDMNAYWQLPEGSVREQFREDPYNVMIEAKLLFWGYVTDIKNPGAEEIVREWMSTYNVPETSIPALLALMIPADMMTKYSITDSTLGRQYSEQPDTGWARKRFLLEHPDYFGYLVGEGLIQRFDKDGNDLYNPTNIPSEDEEKIINTFNDLPDDSAIKKSWRCHNQSGEAILVKYGIYRKAIYGTEECALITSSEGDYGAAGAATFFSSIK